MKKTLFRVKAVALLFVVALVVAGCANKKQTTENSMASIYHWRTVFAPSKTELNFLKQHNIKRLYMKMFDVVAEHNHTNGSIEVVPIATTKFAAEMPEGVEVVPVAYITIDALRAIQGKESEYASLITERMLAMCSYNNCGAISEMHIYDTHLVRSALPSGEGYLGGGGYGIEYNRSFAPTVRDSAPS